MIAFGHLVFLTAALWQCVRTEHDCEPVQATSSALLQSRRQKRDLAEQFSPVELLDSSGSVKSLNQSGLAAHCRPRSQQVPPPPDVVAKIHSEILTSKVSYKTTDATCSGITLVNFGVNTSKTTCCPEDSLSCGGCQVYSSGKCEKCLGGYRLQGEMCEACANTLGWTNELGQTCDGITMSGCNDRPVTGQSSNQACCICGGGTKSPTPFMYPDKRFALGDEVMLKPLPRTARRYSLNADCGLGAHNLTFDGTTGAIYYSSQKPLKAFSVQCEVSAHQAPGLVETVKVSVSVDPMTYGASALVFSPTVTSYPVIAKTPADWRDFSLVCAPEAPWLTISSSGVLSASSTSSGAVTDVETPDGDFVGMDGSVCVASAYEVEEKRSSTFVAIKPKPWPRLDYDTHYLEVVVGEEVPPMKPKIPVGYEESVGGLRPTSFHVACDVDADWGSGSSSTSHPTASFDSIWGIGLVGSHAVFEIQPDGTISINPAESMAKLFDSIFADSLQRKSILVTCGVWGSFPGSSFPALHSMLMVRIKDSICWVSETFQGKVIEELPITAEELCRNKCRSSKRCSHFTWAQDKCKHYRVENEGGQPVTAYAKVTDCTDLGTCLRLKHPDWVIAGDFCPVAFQQVKTGPIELVEILADRAEQMTGQFAKRLGEQGEYVENVGPKTCGSANADCGFLEFKITCTKDTKVKFIAEIIALDGGSDSVWVWMKDKGSAEVWHIGQSTTFAYIRDSPEVDASSGVNVVQFWGREFPLKIRRFKISAGFETCKFLQKPQTIRSVVYKKESAVPQRVMWMTTSVGTNTCPFGNWLVQRADDSDYVNAGLNYFELKGAEQACLGAGLPSMNTGPDNSAILLDFATLACGRPLFPEAAEEALQPLIFDDPSTSQPQDFWLHPCDCLPMAWGSAWPADAASFENIPPASDGTFIPPPFLIVSGQFACPSRQLLKGAAGIHFESEAEQMEPSDCEERCKDYKDCTFYWTGTSHGASTCRLYAGCDSLVREFGMEGDLMAIPHNISCQVANPEGCWKTTLRKQFLTQKQGTSPSFTRAATVINRGGHKTWEWNHSASKSVSTTYVEPFGDMSTIKLLGWSEIKWGQGWIRNRPGIASAVIEGLNPNKNYKYWIKQLPQAPTITNKVAINHGTATTISQFYRRRGWNKGGNIVSTPRGEIVFDFEALDKPTGVYTRTSGTSGTRAEESCRRRHRLVSCNCFAESGICAGTRVNDRTCYAYGTKDVHGTTGRGPSFRAKARCMDLVFASHYSITTSSGPSFSWLQVGGSWVALNASEVEASSSKVAEVDGVRQVDQADEDEADGAEVEEADDGDREVSLDATGRARDEDESEDVYLDDGAEDADSEESQAIKDEDDDGLSDLGDEESGEDGESQKNLPNYNMANVSLVEEGESEESALTCCRRRRRRRRRRRTRRRRSRRRRSRRRRSRRRRTLPTSVSATCPSGQEVLACNCYQDSFTEVRHVWTVIHHCKEVWASGQTCYAKGGYVQAICAKIPPPSSANWQVVTKSGDYWTNKDEGPEVTCGGGRTLFGCWCQSNNGRGDNCAKVWTDGNTCKARASGDRAVTGRYNVRVNARCLSYYTGLLILNTLKIELDTSLLETEAVVKAPSAIGPLAPMSFYYIHLHQQCDSLLLMGGIGVEHCSRPSYRNPNYHPWANKKVLPASFVHGTALTVSCWNERFESFRSTTNVASETLHCVNGNWFNTLNTAELGKFTCQPCVMVGGDGYSKYAKRNEQELYFFSRLAMRVFTELGSVVETSAAAHKFCLKKAASGSGMMLENSQQCPEILAIQLMGNAEIQERMMKLLKDGRPDGNQCLEATEASDGTSPSVQHKACDTNNAQQLITPLALPSIMWNMHKDADRTTGEDLHQAYSSYCGAHGALASLSFGQIFGGITNGEKSTCQFAPVIKFGVFVDSTITYDKTSSSWPNWNTLLADSPILCPDGEALTGFKHQPASNKFRYECSRIGGLGAKYEYFSAQVEVKKFDSNRNNFNGALKMITVDCGMNGLLSGFHFEFSEGGRWARSKYTCSKAGGAPVVMEPSTTVEAMSQDTEGVFCPKRLDPHSGSYNYENVLTGDTLTFETSGAWCVGNDCSAAVGGANPIGVKMVTHEVLNVTDFDGHFEAKGVPSMDGGGAGDLAKALKKLKPPKRPAQPPKPRLQDFKATMPKYAEECLNYQDLWKKVIETHVNEEKEEVLEEAKLEAEPGTEGQELLDYHPCAVAAGAGGIFGRIAGQSGQMAPENMLYSDWNDCMQGDINRDLVAAKDSFASQAFDLVASAVQEGVKLACAAIPGVEIAPLGAGAQVNPDNICGEVVDFVRSMIDLPAGFVFASREYALEEEGFNACNPLQVGFSRVFCDIHCVRDAVIRGDRAIIKNLEDATKISNNNMKKMVEWSTEANRVETEYLDKKIAHSLKVETLYLDAIHKNTAPALVNTAAETKAMMGELRGYADAASFGGISRQGAKDALKNFLMTAQKLDAQNATSRLSQVERFRSQVQSLHDSLQMNSGGLSRAQVVGRQISSEVRKLQKRFAEQERILGTYRTHSQVVHRASKKWKQDASTALVALDHLWWRMRNHLDGYLEAAEREVRSVQASFMALSNYENCQADLEGLLKSYASSMSTMKKSHRKLEHTWREVSNLLGELSSVLRDGDVFGVFVQAEGCASPLAKQTLQQASFAVQGAVFLLHRFQAASLPFPDASFLKEYTSQIHHSYKEAVRSCDAAREHSTFQSLLERALNFGSA